MSQHTLQMLGRLLSRFYRRQDGNGTMMSMYGLGASLILGGFAIDSTNAWQSEELLNITADVAAHAGVVALAQGASRETILEVAEAATEFNMPQDRFGRIIEDARYDITLRHYNSSTNSFSPDADPNAVVVTLQRSKAVHNPLPTFLLGLVGMRSRDIKVQSMAMLAATERCDSSEGIFARDTVTLNGQNQIGAGFCIHSQKAVVLPFVNTFAKGSLVSMPDLAQCQGNCDATVNPGFKARSVNLIMPDIGGFIQEMSAAFNKKRQAADRVNTFFASRPLDNDVSALGEIGVSKSVLENLERGTVIPLTELQFSRLREYPEGLTYNVRCSERGKRRNTLLEIGDTPYSPVMNNIAVTTNCEIHFGEKADIRGSLIITTREQQADTLTADVAASAGDPKQACNPKEHSVIMSMGRMNVPASFARSNVTFVVANDVNLTATPNVMRSTLRGAAIHASGKVYLAAQNEFQSCDNTPDTLAPSLRVLRNVTPVADRG